MVYVLEMVVADVKYTMDVHPEAAFANFMYMYINYPWYVVDRISGQYFMPC